MNQFGMQAIYTKNSSDYNSGDISEADRTFFQSVYSDAILYELT